MGMPFFQGAQMVGICKHNYSLVCFLFYYGYNRVVYYGVDYSLDFLIYSGPFVSFEYFIGEIYKSAMTKYGSRYCRKDNSSRFRCGYYRHSGRRPPKDSPFPLSFRYATSDQIKPYVTEWGLGVFTIYAFGEVVIEYDGKWSLEGQKNLYDEFDFNILKGENGPYREAVNIGGWLTLNIPIYFGHYVLYHGVPLPRNFVIKLKNYRVADESGKIK